jgi:hypothetical protein
VKAQWAKAMRPWARWCPVRVPVGADGPLRASGVPVLLCWLEGEPELG